MIADDEPNHRLGLTRHVHWNELGYDMPLQAEDAEEALEIARSNPIDVLIADVCMPGMDGIELVRQLRQHYPQILVLIISGYEEFEFARSAVEAGAKAYLLKPLRIEEVEKWLKTFYDEIHLAEQIAEADRQMKKKLNNSLQIARERFFEELLEDICCSDESIAHKIELLDLPLSGFSYRLIVVSLDDYSAYMEKDPQTGPTLIHRVMHMLSAVLSDYFIMMVKTAPNRISAFVMNRALPQDDYKSGLDTRFELIQRSLLENEDVTVSVHISREGFQWCQIHKLHREVLHSLNARQLYEKGQILWSENSKQGYYADEFDIARISVKIAEYIQKMDMDGVSKVLHNTFESFQREERLTLSYIHSFSLSVISEISRASEITGFLTSKPYIELCRQVLSCITIAEIEDATMSIVLGYLKALFDYQNQKKSQAIENASRYLREHLEEDTTVKQLSDIVHMNPSYLSVLFKKEMAETISDYVNRLRLEKAKELLREDYKIYDIAQKVGYQNPSYFASQFKKALGCTPAEYRKRMT